MEVLNIFITEEVVVITFIDIIITIRIRTISSSKYFQLDISTLKMVTAKQQMVRILMAANRLNHRIRRVIKPFIYCHIPIIRSTRIDRYHQCIKCLQSHLQEIDLVVLNHLLPSKTQLSSRTQQQITRQ